MLAFLRRLTIALPAVVSLGLAACQNIAASGGVYYNVGLAESFNSVLLMNVIRSAKHYPMYYSALGDFSYVHTTSLGPSVEIPFEPVADGSITLGAATPNITRDRTANVSSLETGDFTEAMHTRISAETLLFFTDGRDRSDLNLILMLLSERLTVTPGISTRPFALLIRTARNSA